MNYTVISYDISDDDKRGKVANLLKNYGVRVQYSVFECRLDDDLLIKVVKRLKPFVETADSVRVYRLCDTCLKKVIILGRAGRAEEPEILVV